MSSPHPGEQQGPAQGPAAPTQPLQRPGVSFKAVLTRIAD